jgi:hypothetical protein
MTNEEARSYTALAMEKCGFNWMDIAKVNLELWDLFDKITGMEAINTAAPLLHRVKNAQIITDAGNEYGTVFKSQ